MTGVLILVAAIVCLVLGYIFYGGWLAKTWGIDPKREVPSQTLEDGVDYVAAKPQVLMGHHFSSIAGAGPINGPIQASVFGWLPVFLWCIIGGIFFGGVQDFGSLFASIRHDGKSIGEIIKDTMGKRAQKLFIIFCLLVLILVIASFVNIVAGTFYTTPDEFASGVHVGFVTSPSGNQTTAIVSILFIFLAVIYGLLTNRAGMKTGPATILGIIGIVAALVFGVRVGFAMNRTAWIIFVAVYIAIASLVPVWILLQPRDYLSSFLLYAMMILAVIGIFSTAVTGRAEFNIPAFTGWNSSIGPLFPALFVTVACGACSGFHALIASGTTSKQLDNEKHAQPIAYGSMLIESALGIISIVALGAVYQKYVSGGFGSPSAAFAGGIAVMFGDEGSVVYTRIYAMLTLAVSVFALTSLDTATRLSRFMFGELFLHEGEANWKEAKGIRKLLANPLFATAFMVIIGSTLGGMSLSAIWALFGAANQLLAGIALLAVCCWLGEVGKNNKMFYIPMAFMLCATITMLIMKIRTGILDVASGYANVKTPVWGVWFQLIFAIVMVILALFLVVEAVNAFKAQAARRKAAGKA